LVWCVINFLKIETQKVKKNTSGLKNISCDKIWSVVTKYDQLWQNMSSCDKIWSVVTKYDQVWQNMISCDKIWSGVTKYDQLLNIYWDVTTKPNQGVTTCPKMSHLMWQNKTRCIKMTYNITRYNKTWPSVTKYDQVWQKMTRCDKMSSSVTRWWREGRGSRRASPCWHCCGPTCWRCGPCGPNLFFEPFLEFLEFYYYFFKDF
jgi:hypothetical protein